MSPPSGRPGTVPDPDSASAPSTPARAPPEIIELVGEARERAVPVIRDGFVGIYRWHAKRTLHEVPIVRAAVVDGEVVGIGLLDLLVPEVGYVYYVAVFSGSRRQGIGTLLLDDALRIFAERGTEVVYAAVQTDNLASRRLFEARGFVPVERKGTGWKDGGLGAWGLRSRMRLVPGEQLLGLRMRPPAAGPVPGDG